MKKPSTETSKASKAPRTKRKPASGQRAERLPATAGPASAPRSRSPRRAIPPRAPRPAASAAAPHAPCPAAATTGARASPPPLFSPEECRSFLLLLAPVLLMALAIGATQALAPKNAYYNLVRLPDLHAVARVPGPTSLAFVTPALASVTPVALPRPERLRIEAPRQAATLPAEPQRQAPGRSLLHSIALAGLPPQMTITARPAPRMHLGRCFTPPPHEKGAQSALVAAASPAGFGRMLARAARGQTADLVVYSERYRQIGFPNGDIPRFYGVCTDVVVRAYRALGIDLQVLVHKARIGTGDTSIDHRRTQTLRRFFARYGVSLPVTDFVEDYQPGDIVTYHRASGRTSQSHIAIVADVIAPSGRPMIVHNRGWGPQLEDALFASTITGHYRFAAGPTDSAPSDQAASPVPATRAHAEGTHAPSPATPASAPSGVHVSENASP